MGRRLVKDSFRGWYSWESRYNAAARMSNAVLQTTKVKNQHESNRLVFTVKQLKKHKSFTEMNANRELKSLRDEFSKMVALGEVYKQHSFDKYDPFLKSKGETGEDPSEFINATSSDRKQMFVKRDTTHSLLSSINASKDNALKENKISSWDVIRQNTRQISTPSATHIRQLPQSSTPYPTTSSHVSSLSQIVSRLSAKRKASICETEASSKLSNNNDVRINFRLLEAIPELGYKRTRKRGRTLPVKRKRTIFPGECKSTYEMRKFMDKEVNDLMYSWTPTGKREAKIELMKKESKIPPLVHRSKTTSAILRDFRTFKKENVQMLPEAIPV